MLSLRLFAILRRLVERPTVKVTVERDLICVRPASAVQGEDAEVRGTVCINLPSKRAVKSIKVELKGCCDVYGWKCEQSTVLHRLVVLDLGGEILEAGSHEFRFLISVPCSTAVSQELRYGRVRHRVNATAYLESLVVSTVPLAIRISALESILGEPPEPFELAVEHFTEDLGPMLITASSPQLAVASLLALSVTLRSTPSPVQIQSISCSIIQSYLITYSDGRSFNPAPQRFASQPIPPTSPISAPVQEVPTRQKNHTGSTRPKKNHTGSRELTRMFSGDTYRLEWYVRLPNAAFLRPTTLEGTDTRIRVRHKLSVEIRYRKEGEEYDTLLCMQKTIHITSCYSRNDSVFLPAYSEDAPSEIRKGGAQCLCYLTVDDLMVREGLALRRSSGSEGVEYPEKL